MITIHLPSTATTSSSAILSPPPTNDLDGNTNLRAGLDEGYNAAQGSAVDDENLRKVVTGIRSAKRMVVVCGAGVSTAASIPDFRSASGLFSKPESRDSRVPIKDLFHVKALSSSTLLPAHHELMTHLAVKSAQATPTPFHQYLATLDQRERLLRVYTQNIDGLEEKAGLTAGIPIKTPSPRKGKRKASVLNDEPVTPTKKPPTPSTQNTPTVNEGPPTPFTPGSSTPVRETNHQPITNPTPRVIPLHGTLNTLHCPLCHLTTPLLAHLPLPPSPVPCPSCDFGSSIRSALSERARPVGSLRASVVLYGEEHPQGESIGRMVERDLKGLGGKSEGREGKVDFLLVAGTSLSIPGVKRIIKEMAKSLHAKSSSQATGAVRTVFVNDQQPKGTEWNDVFDIWVKGDIQSFVQNFLENESYPSLDTPRKRTNFTSSGISTPAKSPSTSSPTKTKAKAQRTSVKSSALVTPPKKARRAKTPKKAQESKVKVEHGDTGLPTPRSTPPSPSRVRKGLSVTTFDQRLRFEGSLTPLSDDDEVPELAPKKERVVATGATPRDDDNPFLG